MTLALRLTTPPRGIWFGGNIRGWVGSHPEYNTYFDIIDGETITAKVDRLEIGRSIENKIVLNNEVLFSQVSRKHALFVREGGKWFLVDQDSKYGTWVRRKGEIMDVKNSGGPTKLEQGDEIMLGKLNNNIFDKPITLLVAAV